MIWNFIRDFFVQYIFGGITSDGVVFEAFFTKNYDGDLVSTYNTVYELPFKETTGGYDLTPISLGDWLSTTMTIICMVLISICFILLVRWLFKAVVSAFLLK